MGQNNMFEERGEGSNEMLNWLLGEGSDNHRIDRWEGGISNRSYTFPYLNVSSL